MAKSRCRLCGRFYAYQHHHTPDTVHCSRECEERDVEYRFYVERQVRRHNEKVGHVHSISTAKHEDHR